jgi:hypothetical protein
MPCLENAPARIKKTSAARSIYPDHAHIAAIRSEKCNELGRLIQKRALTRKEHRVAPRSPQRAGRVIYRDRAGCS